MILGYGVRDGQYHHAYRLTLTAAGDFESITDLGLPEDFSTDAPELVTASQANSSGEIVGTLYDAGAYTWPVDAYVYANGRSISLDTLLDPSSGWSLRAAFAINENHEVVGYGYNQYGLRAFKLTLPDMSACPPPTGASSACQGPGIRNFLTGVCLVPASERGTRLRRQQRLPQQYDLPGWHLYGTAGDLPNGARLPVPHLRPRKRLRPHSGCQWDPMRRARPVHPGPDLSGWGVRPEPHRRPQSRRRRGRGFHDQGHLHLHDHGPRRRPDPLTARTTVCSAPTATSSRHHPNSPRHTSNPEPTRRSSSQSQGAR